jgi:hypothetical protein
MYYVNTSTQDMLSPASTAPPSVIPASPDSYKFLDDVDLSWVLKHSSDTELDDLIGSASGADTERDTLIGPASGADTSILIGPASGVDMRDLKMIPCTDTTLGFGELGAFPGPEAGSEVEGGLGVPAQAPPDEFVDASGAFGLPTGDVQQGEGSDELPCAFEEGQSQDIGDDLCMFDAHQAENEAQCSQDEDLLGLAL